MGRGGVGRVERGWRRGGVERRVGWSGWGGVERSRGE